MRLQFDANMSGYRSGEDDDVCIHVEGCVKICVPACCDAGHQRFTCNTPDAASGGARKEFESPSETNPSRVP